MLSRLIGFCFIISLTSVPALANDEAPAWLQAAAAMSVPTYEKGVPAVVLQKEQHVTVSEEGRITTVTTFAVRILLREGREFARASEFYESDSGKVKEMKAWLIRSAGQTKKYGKDEIVDTVEDPDDVYNESRLKFIDASKDADVGSVFGYQTTTEEKTIFSQGIWSFQNRLPGMLSRYSLTLPQGWSAKGVIFNHPNLEPAVSGGTYTWEMRNLPPIEPEPSSPMVSSMAPRLAVSYFPPGDTQSANFRTFATWTEVSEWLTGLHDPQSNPDEAMAAKVRQITADCKTELDKIRAVGRYVQTIKYISIDIGVSRGGGMRPHPAAEVFAKSYGDCKDKANLMRAMLKVINITAYPVGIHSGDPQYVREEWASPHQFNHCIIAIKVSDETQTATVIAHPKLGRLLIFDATDGDTPVGDLPDEEQGSLALIVAGSFGSLMRMPVTPPEANGLERQSEVNLDSEGAITAALHERSVGQAAVNERAGFRHLSRPEYNQMIQSWITRGASGAKVTKVDPEDDASAGRFALEVEFAAQNYAQLMQNRLLVFKPAIVSRRESLTLTDAKRMQPIVLTSHAYSETVRVKLPAGFDVDEMPDPVKLETAFGSYSTSYEAKDGQLVFTRKLVQRASTIPVEQYDSVRKFYERIRAAEQAPVVLTKK